MDRTHYTQLTLEERYHIQVMRKQGKSLRSIAIGMGRSHSTLSRELRRNQGGRGYRHKQADRLAFQRHRNKAKAKKLTQETPRLYSGENPASLESGTSLQTSPE